MSRPTRGLLDLVFVSALAAMWTPLITSSVLIACNLRRRSCFFTPPSACGRLHLRPVGHRLGSY